MRLKIVFVGREMSKKYESLMMLLEKTYLAMVELGFSPTEGNSVRLIE
jgi:hypothetical protein